MSNVKKCVVVVQMTVIVMRSKNLVIVRSYVMRVQNSRINNNNKPKGETMKKMFVSIVALGAIIASNANAVEISEAACKKSTKYVWVDSAMAADGGRGVCVKKNACDDDDYKNFCDKRFADIQVCTNKVAEELVRRAWECNRVYSLDVNNPTGQDYIACEKNESDGMHYRVFEFDDTNETFDDTCALGGFDGACIALNGDVTEMDGKHICNLGEAGNAIFEPEKTRGQFLSAGGGAENHKFINSILSKTNF